MSDVTIEGGGFYSTAPSISFPDGSFIAVAGRDISITNGGYSVSAVQAREVKLNAGRNVTIDSSTIRARALLQIKAIENLTISNSSQFVDLSVFPSLNFSVSNVALAFALLLPNRQPW